MCRGPYPKYTSCAGISLAASILQAACILDETLFSNSNLSRMDIGPRRIRQGDGSEQCLPEKIEGHLLFDKGRYQGGWVGKKNISRGRLRSIVEEGGCHKDQSGESHKHYGKNRSKRGGEEAAELSFWSSRLSANESIGGRAPFGLITPKFKQNF